MSFLLEALNRKQTEQQTSPRGEQLAQPTFVAYAPESSPNRLIYAVIALAVLLALSVGFILGQFGLSSITSQPALQKQPIPTSQAHTQRTQLNTNLTQAKDISLIQPDVSPTVESLSEENEKLNQKLSEIEAKISTLQTPKKMPAEPQPASIVAKSASTTETAYEWDSKKGISKVPTEIQKLREITKPVQDTQVRSQEPELVEELPLEDVSPELVRSFQAAMQASSSPQEREPHQSNRVTDLHDMPVSFVKDVPRLAFQTHIFATDENQRWIKVNDKTLQEKQWITADIQIRRIEQNHVIMRMYGEDFSLPALTTWEGMP